MESPFYIYSVPLLNQPGRKAVQSAGEGREERGDSETHAFSMGSDQAMEHTVTSTMPLTTTDRSSSEPHEDGELVRRYLDGDMAAFDGLMTRHERQVYGLCLRFVKNREDAMDLSQEVFIKAFENLRAFRGDASFRTWIYRIAVNHCINHVRKNRRHFVEVQESTLTVEPSAHRRLLDGERRQIVGTLIEGLPPKQRAILELRMNENLSYEEIANILDRSVSTIKSSVFFALNKLRKMVEERKNSGASS
jgi:RNA polymerase sigma-70 factor, ECF subfamily